MSLPAVVAVGIGAFVVADLLALYVIYRIIRAHW